MTEAQFSYTAPLEDVESFKKSIVYKLIFLIGRSPDEASQRDWLNVGFLRRKKPVIPKRVVFTTFRWNF